MISMKKAAVLILFLIDEKWGAVHKKLTKMQTSKIWYNNCIKCNSSWRFGFLLQQIILRKHDLKMP